MANWPKLLRKIPARLRQLRATPLPIANGQLVGRGLGARIGIERLLGDGLGFAFPLALEARLVAARPASALHWR